MKLEKLGPTAVLYTDDMEPITVIPINAFLRDTLEQQGRVFMAVFEPVSALAFRMPADSSPADYMPLRKVEIWAESIVRRGKLHLMLFTRNDENALLLRAAFLPGQRKELRDENSRAFARGFLHAIESFGMQG